MSLGEYYANKAVYHKVSRGRLNGILVLAGNLASKKVLDIGCGAGEVGVELKKRGATLVHGLDISPSAVEIAKEVLDGAAVFDLEKDNIWPNLVANNNYDLIILSEVLEHLFKPAEALKKIKQQFTSSLIITVPNVLFWKNRLKIFFGHFEYTDIGLMDRGHIHFFSWGSLQETVRESGYKITASAHHLPTRGTKGLAKIWPGLFSYQFVVKLEPII
ncbi:MAG: class I SAM-dependent methyltransferase [bacterium]|nr:class I SAM-dependent methyltransferase [bacterium]